MTQTAKVEEPSMEEILASIRRIIADDETAAPAAASEPAKPAAAAPAQARPAPEPMDDDDIEAILAEVATPAEAEGTVESRTNVNDLPGAAQPPVFRPIEALSDVFSHDAPAQTRNETVEEARRQFVESSPERPLLSSSTSAAVDSAFNTLANTVLVQNARTLEELVREMMRPMLKAWLDDNLPSMVERMVRAEIERVSRGR